MVWQVSKVFLAATIITLASWLAGRQPKLAGFLMALPLSSMIALLFFQAEYHDPAKATEFARSILVAVPLSLLFFVPFLFAKKFQLDFMLMYVSGIVLLVAGYFVHTWLA